LDSILFHLGIIFLESPGLFVKNILGEPGNQGDKGRKEKYS
jgi:hypothetical protein